MKNNNIQMVAMQRANKEGHDRRMVEIRYIILVGACFLAVVGLMAHMVTY